MTADVTGFVTDDGSPVAGAVVLAINHPDPASLSADGLSDVSVAVTTTDADGIFTFTQEAINEELPDRPTDLFHIVAHKNTDNERTGIQQYGFVEIPSA